MRYCHGVVEVEDGTNVPYGDRHVTLSETVVDDCPARDDRDPGGVCEGCGQWFCLDHMEEHDEEACVQRHLEDEPREDEPELPKKPPTSVKKIRRIAS